PASLQKLVRMRAQLPDGVAIEVDGGIHEQTTAAAVEAGANLLVTGSAVFGSDDPAAAYLRIAQRAGAV
ncbi:MAG: ribulose-phosphate 3-epimerase, partial [Solirubrobacteraceae bacterium]